MRTSIKSVLFSIGTLALTALQPGWAATFSLPGASNALVGGVQYASTSSGDTTASVARRYNVGLNAILAANPGLSEGSVFPSHYHIKIASEFLLPPMPRRGIVINLPEMRLYYYPGNGSVMTFPVGIGRVGKTIPIQNTYIARKTTNPVWTPPDDIRQYNLERGIELPEQMAAGPDNPLGPYAIYLGIPTYLIHSTIFPESIGTRASFGCIRMNESDIEQFFPMVTRGTPVAIVNLPTKIAWNGGHLYLEAHPPLEEQPYGGFAGVKEAISQASSPRDVVFVNWQLASYLTEHPDGLPHEIGVNLHKN